jgi:hypothetical protein
MGWDTRREDNAMKGVGRETGTETTGHCLVICLRYYTCRAIAQAVSRWLPTAEARVRARVW